MSKLNSIDLAQITNYAIFIDIAGWFLFTEFWLQSDCEIF